MTSNRNATVFFQKLEQFTGSNKNREICALFALPKDKCLQIQGVFALNPLTRGSALDPAYTPV